MAFFLIAGDSSAVSSMKKRDKPGLEFIDCPHNIQEGPDSMSPIVSRSKRKASKENKNRNRMAVYLSITVGITV